MGREMDWALLGLGVAAVVLAVLHRQARRRRRASRLAGLVKLELLTIERGPGICMGPPTSTVTFFHGSRDEAEAYFARRVADIVAANPWLASVLDRDESGELAAYYPAVAATKSCFAVRGGIALSRASTAYAAMVRSLAPALCKTSDASVGTAELLWKVSLVPDATEASRFALVVSADHSLLDGYGYFTV